LDRIILLATWAIWDQNSSHFRFSEILQLDRRLMRALFSLMYAAKSGHIEAWLDEYEGNIDPFGRRRPFLATVSRSVRRVLGRMS